MNEQRYSWHMLDAAGDRIGVSYQWQPSPDDPEGVLYFVRRAGRQTRMAAMPLANARDIARSEGFTVEVRG